MVQFSKSYPTSFLTNPSPLSMEKCFSEHVLFSLTIRLSTLMYKKNTKMYIYTHVKDYTVTVGTASLSTSCFYSI